MNKKFLFVITVFLSLLLIIVGNRIAVSGLSVFQGNSEEVVKATVQSIIERTEQEQGLDEWSYTPNPEIIFEAKITSGARKGEIIHAVQSLNVYSGITEKEIKEGNNVVLIHNEYDSRWHFAEFMRTGKLIALGLIFMLCLLIFGGRKGFNTILSLGFTCAAVFMVFIPSILSGKNIYFSSILICIYTIVMTLLIVNGYNRKTLSAAIGCFSGIAATGLITVIMDKALMLTGMLNDESLYLTYLPVENPINLRAIIFAAIIIGAMGAIMDVAMSISSSLWEVKENAREISLETLLRSGITIGRDIMGTMANTLILAYIGSSLSIVLLLSVYSGSLLSLFNREMIVVEVLQALVGSLGILFTIPLTSLVCSVLYLKRRV